MVNAPPDYLRLRPLDAFSDKPFLYTPQNSKYVLYSVGHDRKDDAGMPAGRASNPNAVGDILLDAAF